jgi:prepilin-type N-terminal cleavage/methylation domain-containing protein/prepilin-type processing-associated H-X9-DG protein
MTAASPSPPPAGRFVPAAPAPRPRRQRPNAFTLIELLIVIAIIALLLTILAPSVEQARTLAYERVCLANLHGLTQSMLVYTAQNDHRVPRDRNNTGFEEFGDGVLDNLNNERYIWGDILIWTGCGTPGQFACPADDAPLEKPGRYRASFGLNIMFGQKKHRNLLAVPNSGEKIVIASNRRASAEVAIHMYRRPTAHRHDGKAAYGFVDGGARMLPFEDVFFVKYDPDKSYAELWEEGTGGVHEQVHPGCGWGWQSSDHHAFFPMWDPREP